MRDCNSCKFHDPKASSIPHDCHCCLNASMQKGAVQLPLWEPKETDMTAFATQVGGDHYKTMGIQPVEFALANKLDFFQKDIIKYVTRRKGDKSKRIEDLNKAKHYLEMYIEAITKGSIE